MHSNDACCEVSAKGVKKKKKIGSTKIFLSVLPCTTPPPSVNHYASRVCEICVNIHMVETLFSQLRKELCNGCQARFRRRIFFSTRHCAD